MTSSQPPPRAIQLMQYAGVDPVIIGDLVEEYSTGHARLWFWIQAIGALMTRAPRMSRSVTAVRWLAAIPLAMIAARLVMQSATLFFVGNFSQLRVRIPVAFFLSAATFVVIGVATVPGRKGAAARIALGVVLIGSAVVSALMFLPGERFWSVPLTWGVCSALGGATAYRVLRSRLDLRKT